VKEPARDASSDDLSAEGANKEIRSFRQNNRFDILNERFLVEQKRQDESQEMNPKSQDTKKKTKSALKRNRFASVPSLSTRSSFSLNESRDKVENTNIVTSHINTLQLKVKPKREAATVKSKTPEKVKIKKNIVKNENRRLRTRVAFENNSTTAAINIDLSVGDSEGVKASKKKIVQVSKRRKQNVETTQKTSKIKRFF
jgi:hypothetical protein